MNRLDMQNALVDEQIERFFDRDDMADYLSYVLNTGIVGYDKYTDKEIADEYYDTFGEEDETK